MSQRGELTFWCDCKGCYEAFTGTTAPKQGKTGGTSRDDCYAELPTIVSKQDDLCVYCGYVAQARRLTKEQYKQQVVDGLPPGFAKHNRARARKVLQVNAKTGKIVRSFNSKVEAEAAGISSVRYLIRTGREKDGYKYMHEDGKGTSSYRANRSS